MKEKNKEGFTAAGAFAGPARQPINDPDRQSGRWREAKDGENGNETAASRP